MKLRLVIVIVLVVAFIITALTILKANKHTIVKSRSAGETEDYVKVFRAPSTVITNKAQKRSLNKIHYFIKRTKIIISKQDKNLSNLVFNYAITYLF